MNYTLRQLQILLEVVNCMSITEAARNLDMSQPALSIQLKNFQKEFHTPLVQVIGRKVHITEFGFTVAEMAERILNEADTLRHQTKAFSGLVSGKVRFATVDSGKYLLPSYISDFASDRPEMELTMEVQETDEIYKKLRKNKIDFALVSEKSEVGLEEVLLIENRLFMVGNSKVISKKKPLIVLDKQIDDPINDKIKNKKTRVLSLNSEEMIKQAVIAGLGYALLPIHAIKNEVENQQLHVIPAKGLPQIGYWRMVWLKEKKLSPAAQAYIAFIKKQNEDIIQRKFQWQMKFKG